MEILRFTLSGKNAFFKKPEVNSYIYFTYGNIHKVALLGLFGAVLGYGGYTQIQNFAKSKKNDTISQSYPEFYQLLKDLKISILPVRDKGLISKKIQTYNNSVGYASKELGGNLVVKEQWLENPAWEICVLIDCDEAEDVKKAICGRTCVYYPYLGKNDHPANIENVRVENAHEAAFDMGRLDCLAPKEMIDFVDEDDLDMDMDEAVPDFKYIEALPYALDGWTNNYILKTFVYSDAFVTVNNMKVYQLSDDKKIVFY